MISWARVARNLEGRDFVIGDIHGEFDKVDELLLKAKFDEDFDRLFAVGDLVDRGSQSADVVTWLRKRWFYSIMGNHEQMIIEACNPDNPATSRTHMAGMHHMNGGEWFYKLPEIDQKIIYDNLCELPVIMEIDHEVGLVGLVHADVPGFEWKDVRKNVIENERSMDAALWGRDRIRRRIVQPVNGVDRVYVGHSPVKFTHRLGNVQYIDTGACFPDGHMTMIEISTGEVWTVK